MFQTLKNESISINAVSYVGAEDLDNRFEDYRGYYAKLKCGRTVYINGSTFRMLRNVGK